MRKLYISLTATALAGTAAILGATSALAGGISLY